MVEVSGHGSFKLLHSLRTKYRVTECKTGHTQDLDSQPAISIGLLLQLNHVLLGASSACGKCHTHNNSIPAHAHGSADVHGSIPTHVHGSADVHGSIPTHVHGSADVHGSIPTHVHGSADVHGHGSADVHGSILGMSELTAD